MNSAIRRLWVDLTDSRGAGMVEYALLVALISIGLLAAIGILGSGLWDSFNDSAQAVVDASS